MIIVTVKPIKVWSIKLNELHSLTYSECARSEKIWISKRKLQCKGREVKISVVYWVSRRTREYWTRSKEKRCRQRSNLWTRYQTGMILLLGILELCLAVEEMHSSFAHFYLCDAWCHSNKTFIYSLYPMLIMRVNSFLKILFRIRKYSCWLIFAKFDR